MDITDSAVGDLIVALWQENLGRSLTATGSSTVLGTFNLNANHFRSGLRRDGATGTQTMGGTFSASPNVFGCAINVKAAAGGGGGGNAPRAAYYNMMRAA
jgi:hypothetical protein